VLRGVYNLITLAESLSVGFAAAAASAALLVMAFFPPRAGTCAYVIDGSHTEFMITEYADRIVAIATQIGKLGTVFECACLAPGDLQAAMDEDFSHLTPRVRVRTLIGRRDDVTLNACARHIGEVLASRGLHKCVGERTRARARIRSSDDETDDMASKTRR